MYNNNLTPTFKDWVLNVGDRIYYIIACGEEISEKLKMISVNVFTKGKM